VRRWEGGRTLWPGKAGSTGALAGALAPAESVLPPAPLRGFPPLWRAAGAALGGGTHPVARQSRFHGCTGGSEGTCAGWIGAHPCDDAPLTPHL